MSNRSLTIEDVRKIMRQTKDLAGRDLSHLPWQIVNMTGANLQGAKLANVNHSKPEGFLQKLGLFSGLSGRKKSIMMAANLSQADLHGVDLSDADLRDTQLVEADLHEAILVNADLRQAKLIRANLCGANLTGAKLGGAILSSAQYDENTIWPDRFDTGQFRLEFMRRL